MPGCAVHLELASRVLQYWHDRPAEGPFPSDDSDCRCAFLFGSLAPDLGYFPGGDALLADLAHCVRPVHLARNLIGSAENDFDRALAWGWVTHVLGDVWIHPLINQAAGERICGDRFPGLTYADDPSTHVRIEIGLDALLPARGRWLDPRGSCGINPGRRAVAALTHAYLRTYGFNPSGPRMSITNPLWASFVSLLLLGGRVVSDRPVGPLVRCSHHGLARLARRLVPGGPFEALTNPLPTPDWLLAEAGAIVETFVERFQPHYATNLSGLPDYNLDTGEVEGESPSYPLTVTALEELSRRITVLPEPKC